MGGGAAARAQSGMTSEGRMLSQKAFEIQPTTRTSFGAGAVAKLGKRARQLEKSRALIITDPGIVRAGVAERVSAVLGAEGIETAIFDGVSPNPDVECVEHGARALRAHGDAAVIALGGGSSLDAAKAIALVGANRGSPREFTFGCKPERPGRPVIAIPTTAGTGSETNMFGVITDRALGRKILIAHASVQPVAIFLDPELGVGAPREVTATCGMDVLTHAIEALTSNRGNPYSSALALRAIAITGAHLASAFDDGAELEPRAQMLLASHLAGLAFSSSGLGICHAMGHPLSARFGAAHGQTLATLLPHVMRYNLEVCERDYADVAVALDPGRAGAPVRRNAEHAIEAVESLRARVGTDRSARELGVLPELIPTLVEDALADVLMFATPKLPQAADVVRLYEAAL
jgi:alcohol dehydrogenase